MKRESGKLHKRRGQGPDAEIKEDTDSRKRGNPLRPTDEHRVL